MDYEDYKIEINLLIRALKKNHGWDFSNYKRSSLFRRIDSYLRNNNLCQLTDIIPHVKYSEKALRELIQCISVPVTNFFRDPGFYLSFRKHVVPVLKTYPYSTIWNPGCANGMETYSIAILLAEANLSQKIQILGTDINEDALETATYGTYRLKDVLTAEKSYLAASGVNQLWSYFDRDEEKMTIKPEIQQMSNFSFHNLVNPERMMKSHVIICRNVFIYFNRELQCQVIDRFIKSLCPGGFLCLGTKETLEFTEYNDQFKLLCDEYRIYRRKYVNI